MPDKHPESDGLTQPDLARARRDYHGLRNLVVATLVLGSASCFTLNLVDPDLWGHVCYGKEWIADGKLHRTATHTFTAEGHRWINHENLAELTLAIGFDHLGVTGMLVAKCLLGMAILGLMYLVAWRRDVRTLTIWAFLLLVASNLKAFFPMRPQLLSFLCCAILLTLIEAAFARWRATHSVNADDPSTLTVDWRWLVLTPLVMIVWVNAHGGFVAGLCIIGALLAGRVIEAFMTRGLAAWRVASLLAMIGVASLCGALVNPYGLGLVQWLVESLGSPRPEITEWAAPKMSDPVFWPLVALLATNAIAWGATDRRRDWVKIILLSLVAWQSVSHLRHIAFLALLSGFWTPVHLQSVLSQIRRKAAAGLPVTRPSPWIQRLAVGALGVAMVLQSVGLVRQLTRLPVHRSMYPVDALQFMVDRDLSGRLVVCFNWAQYALAALAPETTVSFDGRFRTCYPQEVVDMNFDWLLGEYGGRRFRSPTSGPVDPLKVLRHHSPDLVLVDRSYPHPTRVMQQQSIDKGGDWALLYQDAVAQVWGRASIFADPSSPRWLPNDQRIVGEHATQTTLPWPAFPTRIPSSPVAQDGIGGRPGKS